MTVVDKTVSQSKFQIRACGSCDFWYTSPRPDKDEIGSFYLSSDYTSHVNEAKDLKDHIYHFVRRCTIRSKYRLIKAYHESGTVLDLGCGTGDFIAFLQAKGYTCIGIEPSHDAQGIATSKDLKVLSQLDELDSSVQFDVITLWHVLEHIHDPRKTLKILHGFSADNGVLIIAVPDRESWDASHYQHHWAALDVPRHLYHFRQQDVSRLLNEAGFEVLSTRKMWFDAPYVSMLSERHLGTGPILAMIKGAIMGEISNLKSILGDRPTSSSLYIAQKR